MNDNEEHGIAYMLGGLIALLMLVFVISIVAAIGWTIGLSFIGA